MDRRNIQHLSIDERSRSDGIAGNSFRIYCFFSNDTSNRPSFGSARKSTNNSCLFLRSIPPVFCPLSTNLEQFATGLPVCTQLRSAILYFYSRLRYQGTRCLTPFIDYRLTVSQCNSLIYIYLREKWVFD